ncbi:hypothetical protein [Pedobacter gandavensis]|uniref:hypothetical protein n=1 Tax=Pedobacter gandavensis TaxID=2679963 RepID=UPI00292DD9F0|nr:hypothetical protein [Pedobacter gandavensis]
MKTSYPIGVSLIALTFFSCNSAKMSSSTQNKDTTATTVVDTNITPKPIGGDKDEHGCLIAAGYTWSALKKECIRSFELKTKMKDLNNSTLAGYVMFSPDNKQVELFAAEFNPTVILNAKGTDVYASTDKKYMMAKDAQKRWFVTKSEDGKTSTILQQE